MTGSPPLAATADSLRSARRQVGAAFNAGFSGLRLIRSDPKAVLAWIVVWFLGFAFAAFVVAFTGGVHQSAGHPTLGARFGPYGVLLIGVFLLIWAATTVATYRLALQPDRRRFFYLDLGVDELRLAALSAVAFILVLVLWGVPAFLLLAIASPLMQAAPMLAKYVAVAGAAATIAFDWWVFVRLSLIAIETFAEGRFHLTAYWPLTRGRFWYLNLVYLVCALISLFLTVVLGGAWAVTAGLWALIGQPHGADIGRRIAQWTLIVGYTGIVSAISVTSMVLFCGAQAHAFRAITGVSPRRKGWL